METCFHRILLLREHHLQQNAHWSHRSFEMSCDESILILTICKMQYNFMSKFYVIITIVNIQDQSSNISYYLALLLLDVSKRKPESIS